jgi:hypothetical protein
MRYKEAEALVGRIWPTWETLEPNSTSGWDIECEDGRGHHINDDGRPTCHLQCKQREALNRESGGYIET